ncbi:scaffoldin [Piromyces sp. E2]|nr:scaffoldin [Piromyces sp. E2]|eukprot:OUM61671.1 scaffoldin [Piromyces sp. E2]
MKVHINILTLSIAILSTFVVHIQAASDLSQCDQCDNVNVNPKYCIKNKVIHEKDTNDDNKYKPILNQEIFFFDDNENLLSDQSPFNISFGYICSQSDCTKISTSGVYLNDKTVVIYKDGKFEIKNGEEGIYLNGAANGINNALISCSDSECTIINAFRDKHNNEYEYYINYDESLIRCSKKNNICENKKNFTGIFLNYDENKSQHPLIKCDYDNDKSINKCESIPSFKDDVYYINENDKSTLIYCSNTTNCDIFSPPSGDYYYINGYPTGEDVLIYCDDGKCSLGNVDSPSYYITSGDKNGLIKCTNSNDNGNNGGGNGGNGGNGRKKRNTSSILCYINTPSSFTGYFINGDSNLKNSHPLIKCTDEGCKALKIGTDILPGFYVNANEDESDEIIICNENKCESKIYTSSDTNKNIGSIQYNDKTLKLCIDSNSDDNYSQTTSEVDDIHSLYYYLEVNVTSGFPSITTQLTTLFKVNKYSIVRLIVDSNYSIEKSSNKISTGGSIGSDIALYVCTSKTKTCVEKNSCTSNTYLLDNSNSLAYYCNDKNTLTNVTDEGYYIDHSRSKTSNYVIKCIKNSSDSVACEYYNSPKYYFINAGYNKGTLPLIMCNNNNCETSSAEVGYYLSGEMENNSHGIIKCTSSSNCSIVSTIKPHDHYYINKGFDKHNKALINCYKKSCITFQSTYGNYITDDNSLLIKCEGIGNCNTFSASSGYYDYSYNTNNNDAKKKIIHCELKSSVICEPMEANSGFYLSNTSNILINCTGNSNKCTTIVAKNGIFRSATTRVTNTSKRDNTTTDTEQEKSIETVEHEERASKIVYNIIVCSATSCNELSANELSAIPYCTFDNNKCFINTKLPSSTSSVTSIAAGGYCTNSDREIFYFATDTIVTESDILYGTTSIYTYTTTNTNCIKVSNAYANNYFTITNNIYHVDEGQITQILKAGYYFINVHTNTLVNGNDISNYNDENVKLFKCNDNSCSVINKPKRTTYIADVNKRIIKFNPNSDSYSFAYENDIICMYSNNKCIPRSDMKNQEFCITYKGELVLASSNIKSRETGECYKGNTINNSIYGISQHLYSMTTNYAEIIDESSYYIVSLSSNTTASYKDFTNKNNPIRIYGCIFSQCNEIEPVPGLYYYDPHSQYLFTKEDGEWISPTTSGYALTGIDPNEQHIYRFTINSINNRVTLNERVGEGYYYTTDNEMYHCDENNDACSKIDSSDYYFTNNGMMFYCVYDSEGLEKTSCIKQSCNVGQLYYINEKYYRCESGFNYSLLSSKYCKYDENVIVNFLTEYSEEYPVQIKNAIESISINNNSTAVIKGTNTNYMNVIPGIFTNCTYNVEDRSSTFDMVCINNFVSYNKDSDNVEICSVSQMGYVECVEDENNSHKCNVSGSYVRYTINLFSMIIVLFGTILYLV